MTKAAASAAKPVRREKVVVTARVPSWTAPTIVVSVETPVHSEKPAVQALVSPPWHLLPTAVDASEHVTRVSLVVLEPVQTPKSLSNIAELVVCPAEAVSLAVVVAVSTWKQITITVALAEKRVKAAKNV